MLLRSQRRKYICNKFAKASTKPLPCPMKPLASHPLVPIRPVSPSTSSEENSRFKTHSVHLRHQPKPACGMCYICSERLNGKSRFQTTRVTIRKRSPIFGISKGLLDNDTTCTESRTSSYRTLPVKIHQQRRRVACDMCSSEGLNGKGGFKIPRVIIS